MAHELEIVNGNASFAFNGKRGNPWHLLGTDVDGDMPLHVMLEASRADYTVNLEPIYINVQAFNDERGLPVFINTEVEGHYATVRTGGAEPEAKALGVVKGGYEVTQTSELAEIAQAMVGLGGGDACWDTMGVLNGGKRFFAYLRLPSMTVDPEGIADKVDMGLVVATSFDGTLANTIGFSSVRVVCSNTLSMALGGLTQKISVKHTSNSEERLSAAAAGLSMYSAATGRMQQSAQRMLSVPGHRALNAVLKDHWPSLTGTDAYKTSVTKRDNVRADIVNTYQFGRNNSLMVGTNGWAVYNAAVEYLDWQVGVRKSTNRAERIISSTTLDDKKRAIAKTVLDLVPM